MHSRTTWSWAAVAGLTLVVACKLAPHLTGPDSCQLVQILVSPASVTLREGAAQQFSAFGRKNTGDSVSVSVNYTATGGAITPNGLYTAGQAPGNFRVMAKQNGGALADSSTVTVTTVPVASVTVSPPSASIATGATVQLAATTRDAGGNVLTGRVISWGSSNTTVATVSGSGLVTGVSAGAVTITATSEGKNGTAAVTVAAPPPPAGCGNTSPGVCYYVATSGNDANPGTAAQPFATIQHAADIVNPGDGVLVGDGVYTGGATIVTISRSGTATNRIVFRAAHRWLAVIDGQNNLSTTGIAIPGGYIRVEGFEVRNTNRYGIDTYLGHDQTVVGNHVHDIGHICTGSTGGIVAIDAYAPNLVIEGNLIHDIGRLGPGENGCTPLNDYWQNHDHGIYNGIGTNVVIRNNVFYNLKHGWAIQRYDGGGTVVDGLYIENNTFAGANPNRDAQIIIATTTTNLVIANNIFYQPATAGGWVSRAGSRATLTGHVASGGLQIGGAGLAPGPHPDDPQPPVPKPGGVGFFPAEGSPGPGAGGKAGGPPPPFPGRAR